MTHVVCSVKEVAKLEKENRPHMQQEAAREVDGILSGRSSADTNEQHE
jgi:hypothetical protein